jgi:hypothetical protein
MLEHMFASDALHEGFESETVLYSACVRWAEHHMSTNAVTTNTVREMLSPALRHIRFLIMSPSEFVKVCNMRPNLLSDREMLETLSYLVSPNSHPKPDFICQKVEDDTNVNTTFFTFAIPHEDTDEELGWSVNTFNQISTVAFTIGGDSKGQTINIIQVPSQITGDSEPKMYRENLTIYIREIDSPYQSIAHFSANVMYNSYINILLNEPIVLKELRSRTVSLKIVFHTTGRYPISKRLQTDLLPMTENLFIYNCDENFIHLIGFKAVQP